MQRHQALGAISLALAFATTSTAQDDDLLKRITALENDLERLEFGSVIAPRGDRAFGLGASASKVYAIDNGWSLGGYGEFLFQQRSGGLDTFDALRAVIYVGYRFDEHWLVNTEIEVEHGTTGADSGSTSSSGSVSLELGYIDYLRSEAFNLRAGLLLLPVGWINENHEPTAFLGSTRPLTEQRLIPSTWRATGVGAFGAINGFEYRGYLVSSLNGEEFSAGGLRGGRQKGSRSASDDFAFAGRLDWVGTEGLVAGTSIYIGDTGQDGIDTSSNAVPSLRTTILEAHVDYRHAGWRFRGLYATALINEAGMFNTSTGNNLARRLEGWYAEAGYDLMPVFCPDSTQSLTPFVRFESVDTQADLPTGFTADPTQDEEILTFGLDYKPVDGVVIKLDYQAFDVSDDRFNVLFGYAF